VTIQRPAAPAVDVADLEPAAYEAAIPGLAELILDAVEGGASVNFHAYTSSGVLAPTTYFY
jgi:hypothetical protein